MWLWIWFAFVVVFVLIPLTWGWSYRGWGPPYPGSDRRRRITRTQHEAIAARAEAAEDGWGVLADVLWVMLLIAVVWLAIGLVLAF